MLVTHVLLSEHHAGQPTLHSTLQSTLQPTLQPTLHHPDASLLHEYGDPTAFLAPSPGIEHRSEDAFMFVLAPKQNHSDTVSDNETAVTKLRRFAPETQIALIADGYMYEGRAWKPLSSSRACVQLAAKAASVWDSDCLRTFAEITASPTVEYRQPEKTCVVIYSDRMIIGLRFLSEDDEILFVQHLDSAMKLHENYNPNRPTLPPLPRDPFTPPPTLFCKTVIKKSATKIRSLTIVSQYPWIGSFEPLVSLALHEFNESEKIEVITSLYANLNSADVSSLPRLSVSERTIMRCAYEPAEYFLSIFEAAADRGARRGGEMHDMLAEDWDGISFTASVRYSEQMQEVDLPVYLYPEEIGDFSLIKLITTFSALDAIHPPAFLDLRWRNNAPFLWHPHLDCGARTHPFVLLLNALVTEKRVLFLGSGRTGGEVAGYVHAAAAAAGGGGTVVPDVLERVASVVNVGDLIGLQRSARFIAGSTDPAVEQRTDLWDVLLDINSGKITVSPQINLSAEGMANPTVPAGDIEWMCQGYWIGDAEFVLELISAIQNETPELQVRQLVYDHLQRFLDVTAAFELETCNTTLLGHPPVPPAAYPGIESGGAFFRDDQAKSAELCMLRNRIEGFRLSRGYFRYTQTHNARLQKSYLGPSFPLRALMAEIHNPDRKYQPPTARLVQILFLIQDTVLPGPNGAQTELLAGLRTKGIAVFAAGMMHERWEVRRACTRILWRLDWHMIGTIYVQLLNPFYRLCYSRTSHLLLNQADDETEPSASEAPPSVTSPTTPSDSKRKSKGGRMSILFEQRSNKNASRISFNKVSGGYMRGSVLGAAALNAGKPGSLLRPIPGIPMPEAKPSLPGWMAEVKMDSPVLESASIRSGRSGAASRPADMGDLDRMLQSVEKMGFQGISFGAVGGLGGLRAVGDSDEDEVEFETGRGMGAGVPGQQPPQRGQSVTAQSGADRIGRNPSVGPGGSRAPRSASAGAPSMPSYGGIGQKSPGLGIEPVPPTGGGVRTPPGGGGYTPQPAGGPQSMQRGAPQPGFSPNLSSQQMRGATPVGFNVNPIPGNQGGFVPPTRTGSVGGPVPMNQQLSSSGFPAGRSPSLGRQPRPLPAQPGQQQQQQQYQK